MIIFGTDSSKNFKICSLMDEDLIAIKFGVTVKEIIVFLRKNALNNFAVVGNL